MRRSSKYHSFPMFALSFVMIACGLILLSLEFGWIQIEFDSQNAGISVESEFGIADSDDLKMMKSIDFTFDTATEGEAENPDGSEEEPFIAVNVSETYPSRSELTEQLPVPSIAPSEEISSLADKTSPIEVVEYVEQQPAAPTLEPGEIQNASLNPQPPVSPPLQTPKILPLLRGSDLKGRFHRIGEPAGVLASTLVFLSPDCSFSAKYIPQLNRMASAFRPKGIEFFGVISDRKTTRRQAEDFRRTSRIGFPVLFDTTGVLRHLLRPTHTTQTIVIDPQGTLLYTGRIDDRFADAAQRRSRTRQHYLTRVLQSVVSGDAIRIASTEPVGCPMEPSQEISADFQITWAREIAPVIQAHCADCHQAGEATPFTLTNYEDVRKRARQISLITRSRYMPPWKPAEGTGSFQHEARLTNREIDLISRWAEAGAPHGSPTELPPPASLTQGWRLGKPDRIVDFPETILLPAEREDVYQFFVIPSGLQQDALIEAVEFRPGRSKAVEHMALYCDTTGQARQLDEEDPAPGYKRTGGPGFQPTGLLGRWVPGASPHRFPEQIGRRIPAGSDLVLEIHYRPSGRAELDRPRFGIHFAAGNKRMESTEILVANPDLEISAGEREQRHIATYRLPVDIAVHSISPHLRRLGRSIKVSARLPDESEVSLLQIDDWDFKWQNRYLLRRPLRLPRGSRLVFEAVFDNSAGNPFNPHSPPQPVSWGERATDETALCFFDVTTDDPNDLSRLTRHNQMQLSQQFQQRSRFERLPQTAPGNLNAPASISKLPAR